MFVEIKKMYTKINEVIKIHEENTIIGINEENNIIDL